MREASDLEAALDDLTRDLRVHGWNIRLRGAVVNQVNYL
jgi:hypothetical protein